MIPREWSPGVKWFGLYWPPAEWWFKGPWYYNHPLSHLIGGVACALVMLLVGFSGVQTVTLAAILGASREENQVEQWSERGGYPAYSAVGDAGFVILGAVLVAVVRGWWS